MIDEGVQSTTDRVARRFIAGDYEQSKVGELLKWRHRAALDLGIGQRARDIILRVFAPLLD